MLLDLRKIIGRCRGDYAIVSLALNCLCEAGPTGRQNKCSVLFCHTELEATGAFSSHTPFLTR